MTSHLEGFEVGLDACAAAAVGAGDGQHARHLHSCLLPDQACSEVHQHDPWPLRSTRRAKGVWRVSTDACCMHDMRHRCSRRRVRHCQPDLDGQAPGCARPEQEGLDVSQAGRLVQRSLLRAPAHRSCAARTPPRYTQYAYCITSSHCKGCMWPAQRAIAYSELIKQPLLSHL